MILSLLGIGILGLLGTTVLCPIVSFLAYRLQRIFSSAATDDFNHVLLPSSIEIIIPAHNEVDFIAGTLDSIQRCIDRVQTELVDGAPPSILIHVGADGCTDATVAVARQRTGVHVTESAQNAGKWATLTALAKASSAEWIIFADAGAVWRSDFLVRFLSAVRGNPRAMAVAPSYHPARGSGVTRSVWAFERTMKRLETWAGGPVSVHGATIGYKATCLKKALEFLGETLWWNDDVVIPLALRVSYRTGVILYAVGQIQDVGGRHDRLDVGRRKRMLLGNLQWVKSLWPMCFHRNGVAGLVALRRIFRILWAYWLACFVLAAAFAFHAAILPGLAALVVLIFLSGSIRQLLGAAWVSFLTPFCLVGFSDWQVSWK